MIKGAPGRAYGRWGGGWKDGGGGHDGDRQESLRGQSWKIEAETKTGKKIGENCPQDWTNCGRLVV